MARREVQLERRWPESRLESLRIPYDDVVLEEPGGEPDTYVQLHGPFTTYERTLTVADGHVVERCRYLLVIPWFAWFFGPLVRRHIARHRDPGHHGTPFWAPPDRLTPQQVAVFGLLAAGSMSSAFVNTLFTQTVAYAGDDFGVGDWGRGVGGTIVRLGIVLAIPLALAADRVGRRRVIAMTAWLAPLIASLGALAPNFPALVATQAVGRPLGLALDLLLMVVAAEEMPRNSRAYAVSILAMASGLGASVAVVSLPIADIGQGAWRGTYVLALVWLWVARDLARRLPETRRFEVHRDEIEHHHAPPMRSARLLVQCAVAFFGNLIVAPASFFQNGYLKDERGYAGVLVTAFTLATAMPAVVGLVMGGRIADQRGRRLLAVTFVPLGATLLALSFGIGGPTMWLLAAAGGVLAAGAYPALAVYRSELFPTGHRSLAGALILASALIGGSIGLLLAGRWLDDGVSHLATMVRLLIGPVIVAVVVWLTYPETAHRELEEINPEDGRTPDDSIP